MSRLIRRFVRNERGATAIEYGLLIALLALAIVVGVGNTSNAVRSLWGNNANRVNQAMQ